MSSARSTPTIPVSIFQPEIHVSENPGVSIKTNKNCEEQPAVILEANIAACDVDEIVEDEIDISIGSDVHDLAVIPFANGWNDTRHWEIPLQQEVNEGCNDQVTHITKEFDKSARQGMEKKTSIREKRESSGCNDQATHITKEFDKSARQGMEKKTSIREKRESSVRERAKEPVRIKLTEASIDVFHSNINDLELLISCYDAPQCLMVTQTGEGAGEVILAPFSNESVLHLYGTRVKVRAGIFILSLEKELEWRDLIEYKFGELAATIMVFNPGICGNFAAHYAVESPYTQPNINN
ncbi:uncharacterized protein G2W53_039269 [Senna tora]|uniref:Uncharacterized protein n=1 Tax=Senna tora TaxID=362788 RepID=A0A834W3C9_9FABA|nr:uncharacterized protein G2W53_039269 [Senna tora]